MTVNETKVRIEEELKKVKESFGAASDYVEYDIQIGENEIEGAHTDITYIFGSFAIGKKDSAEEDKLYLPLDAELDDDDNVNEEDFEKNLAAFLERIDPIREKLLNAEDRDAAIDEIISDFDHEIDEKYRQEIEKLNRAAKRNLITAGIAAVGMALLAVIILVIDKLG